MLISDGCTYQNKNKVLCSALANLSVATGQELEQIILERGHTMMEVDSVHSTLENLFTARIYSPLDYVSRVRQARPTHPYTVNYLEYTFFKDYEHVPGNFTSIRPGERAGDAKVNNIRGLLFKDNEVYFKLRHTDNWELMSQKKRTRVLKINEPRNLYESPLKIDESKYKSLQSLKQYMHKDYH